MEMFTGLGIRVLMVMRVVMGSLVVGLERVVGVDLFFFGSGVIRGTRCPFFVLFITLICLYPSIQGLLGCAVLSSNCDAVAAPHAVLVALCALSPNPCTQKGKKKSKRSHSLQYDEHPSDASTTPIQCNTLTTPPSTPNSLHILSIVLPINSASLASDPIKCS